MQLSDHTISDLFGFATVISSTFITQFFLYRAATRRADTKIDAQTVTLKSDLRHSECRLSDSIDEVKATATNNNKEIAVVKALVDCSPNKGES